MRAVITHLAFMVFGWLFAYEMILRPCTSEVSTSEVSTPARQERPSFAPSVGVSAKLPCPLCSHSKCPACPTVVSYQAPERTRPYQLVLRMPAGNFNLGSDNVSSETIEAIYHDAMQESARSFASNGGLKDKVQISAGQGPKLRIWDYYGPFYNCASRERVGRIGDGGKWVCGVRTFLQTRRARPCVIYSIGSKGEVSFEQGAVEKLGHCEVHVFDPTLTGEQRDKVLAVRGTFVTLRHSLSNECSGLCSYTESHTYTRCKLPRCWPWREGWRAPHRCGSSSALAMDPKDKEGIPGEYPSKSHGEAWPRLGGCAEG